MHLNQAAWIQRNQYLQSLYISPMLQAMLPNELIRERKFSTEAMQLMTSELPRLNGLNEVFWRGAGTCFFNLKSARMLIEAALEVEREGIALWLAEETTARYLFDAFADPHDPYYGFGVHWRRPTQVQFAETLRLVLQRMPQDTFVLWSAYPVLAPGNARWSERYDYPGHAPRRIWPPVFYYFLNCYLSVTSSVAGVDAIIQGFADVCRRESRALLEDLAASFVGLDPQQLAAADKQHLTYELTARCLDETLPSHYVTDPTVFLEALLYSLRDVQRAITTN